MKYCFSLKGKIALVTGASYGIGFAIASGMAKAGCYNRFHDIKQELVDKGLGSLQGSWYRRSRLCLYCLRRRSCKQHGS